MVYLWEPGYSWKLVQVYEDNDKLESEITFTGEKAAAIMLKLEEAHAYKELGYKPAYAIKTVYVGYNSVELKKDNCANYVDNLKKFDFVTQSFTKLQYTKEYVDSNKKVSLNFEKIIFLFKKLKLTQKYISKSKQKAKDFSSKIDKLRKTFSMKTLKELRKFKTDYLKIISNSKFQDYLNQFKEENFKNIVQSHAGGSVKVIGTKDLPALDCLNIKQLVPNAKSGFYWIQNECMKLPLYTYCDYTVYAEAVDIFIYNDSNPEPNPDLSYLDIKDFNSIRYQCAKVGLYPIQINNKETLERIYQVLTAKGYSLSKPIVVPLGYDYTCVNNKCSGIVNSLNDKQSPGISSFFFNPSKKNESASTVKSGPFYGLGYSTKPHKISFSPDSTTISGIVCSTNHNQVGSKDTKTKTISCEVTPENNPDIFIEGSDILIECPAACQNVATTVYGSAVYNGKSSICKAAIHAGMLSTQGGKIYVRVVAEASSYNGSTANGIKSLDLNKQDGSKSFNLIEYTPTCPIDTFQRQVEADSKEEKTQQENLGSFLETKLETSLRESHFDINDLEGIDQVELESLGLSNMLEKAKRLNKSHKNTLDASKVSHDTSSFKEMEDLYTDYPYRFSEKGWDKIQGGLSNMISKGKNDVSNIQDKSKSAANTLTDAAQSGSSSLTNSITDTMDTIKKSSNDLLASQSKNLKELTSPEALKSTVKDEINSVNEENKKKTENANPLVPQDNFNSPQDAQTAQPTEPAMPVDLPATTDNKQSFPTTDDGINEVNEIRKSVDWDYIGNITKKLKKVTEFVKQIASSMAWSKEGSNLANAYIKSNFNFNF